LRARAALACALLAGLAGCRRESPEASIRSAFDGCVKAIEHGDARTPAQALAPAFQGPGGMGRDEAGLYLAGLLRQGRIGITVLSDRIEVRGNRAVQTVQCLLTSRQGGELLPGEASRRPFLLTWERTGSGWRLQRLETPEAP
jgi:hypothetical protein